MNSSFSKEDGYGIDAEFSLGPEITIEASVGFEKMNVGIEIGILGGFKFSPSLTFKNDTTNSGLH